MVEYKSSESTYQTKKVEFHSKATKHDHQGGGQVDRCWIYQRSDVPILAQKYNFGKKDEWKVMNLHGLQ